jgi:hypothetical protein
MALLIPQFPSVLLWDPLDIPSPTSFTDPSVPQFVPFHDRPRPHSSSSRTRLALIQPDAFGRLARTRRDSLSQFPAPGRPEFEIGSKPKIAYRRPTIARRDCCV